MRESRHVVESGVVEGFYGKPWSDAARKRFLDIAASNGFTCYIYAPKDDPYHREKWSEPYPERERKQLASLIKFCKEKGLDFCWALSPGLSIKYSSPKDLKTLAGKFELMSEMGVKTFALFLDDIPTELQHKADKNKWDSLAAAQSYLVNKLHDRLAKTIPGSRLWFCPTEYIGVKPTPYLETIGENIIPEVEIFWTGPLVVSPRITVEDAESIGKALKRKPILWDNYPVNDYNPAKLNLGPLLARDAGLTDHIAGYFTNPMNQAAASIPAVLTIADYLEDPSGYVPEKSWKAALKKPWGKKLPAEAVAALETFCAPCRPGFFYGERILQLVREVNEAKEGRYAALSRSLDKIMALPAVFKSHDEMKEFYLEVKPFVDSLVADANAAKAAIGVKKSPGDEQLKKALDRAIFKSNGQKVKGTAGKILRIFATEAAK